MNTIDPVSGTPVNQPSSLVNPFSPQNQAAMSTTFGSVQAPGSFFRMEGDSPLDQNAFIGALEDARASGKTSFNVNGNTYPVK